MSTIGVLWCIYADGAIVTAAFLTWWLWRHPPPDAVKPLRGWERLAVSVGVGMLWPLFWADAPNILGVRKAR